MYNAEVKHEGPLRTRGNWKKVEPQASVFKCSQCFTTRNTRLRLLHVLYDIEIIIMWAKKFRRFDCLIVWAFPLNSGITKYNSKNGLYNKVTMTTLDTMTFLLMFSKKWRQDPGNFRWRIRKVSEKSSKQKYSQNLVGRKQGPQQWHSQIRS